MTPRIFLLAALSSSPFVSWPLPHGGDLLAVEVDYQPGLARKLRAIPGVKLHQDGDHEKTFLFPVSLFKQLARIVKPRKRRILT